MRKIYDTFCFFNEFDLLELRLNILDPYVDYFVLSEASVTHTGQPKPFYFEENKERYAKFLDKIIHVKVTDTPNDFINLPVIDSPTTFDEQCLKDIYTFIQTQTNRFNRNTEHHYGRDFFQKECVRRGLETATDKDIIMFSDCDEIPNPEIVKNVHSDFMWEYTDALYTFRQTAYYYYLNLLKENDWKGTRIGTYGHLKHYSYNELRGNDHMIIPNGGWHFSYMGGPEKVRTKIESFSAQEMNNPHVLNSINDNITKGIDPFFRSMLTQVPIDESYPKYLLENLDKYKHMIK